MRGWGSWVIVGALMTHGIGKKICAVSEKACVDEPSAYSEPHETTVPIEKLRAAAAPSSSEPINPALSRRRNLAPYWHVYDQFPYHQVVRRGPFPFLNQTLRQS